MAGNNGFTRNHTLGLVIPLLCTFSAGVLTKLLGSAFGNNAAYQPVRAILGCILVSIIVYLLYSVPVLGKFLSSGGDSLKTAVMSGLLVGQVMTFMDPENPTMVPSMSTITLWLYYYFNAVEKQV